MRQFGGYAAVLLLACSLPACDGEQENTGYRSETVTVQETTFTEWSTPSRGEIAPGTGALPDDDLSISPSDTSVAGAGQDSAFPPRPAGRCDPNYTPCVPVASDVDCAGGRGNGPAYVRGPVRVIGRDVYGLDRDGDGIGCDH